MPRRQFNGNVGYIFERRDTVASRFAQSRQHPHGPHRVGHRKEGRFDRAWHWKQLQAGSRHDAERALGADEQVTQVIAGVVFAQTRQAVEHTAIGRDDFQAQHQVARHAVMYGRETARIGRDVPADLATALRSERQRKVTPGRARGGLHFGQQATRFDDHREIVGIDVPDAVHAAQAQHDLRALCMGCRAAAIARVATVRHHAHARFVADRQHGRHFGCRCRQRDERRVAAIQAAKIGQERLDGAWIFEAPGRTECRSNRGDGLAQACGRDFAHRDGASAFYLRDCSRVGTGVAGGASRPGSGGELMSQSGFGKSQKISRNASPQRSRMR